MGSARAGRELRHELRGVAGEQRGRAAGGLHAAGGGRGWSEGGVRRELAAWERVCCVLTLRHG